MIDGLLLALVAALFGQLTHADPTVHAIFGLLVIRALVAALSWTMLMLIGCTLLLVVFSTLPGGDEPVTFPEFFEWAVMISLVGVVGIVASRREQAARHFASLYHDATERLVSGQEEQRRRFAQDLHDGVGQGIGALLLRLDALGNRVADDPQQAALVESSRELTVSVLDEVRGLALRSYPAIAHPAGLGGALQALADHAGIPVELTLDPLVRPGILGAPAETALFRIVQEALANTARHAGGSRARITVELIGNEVHAAVADDGVGFALDRAAGQGIGLLAMQERASRAGGSVTVETGPGRGTIVSVRLPCAAADEPGAVSSPMGATSAPARSKP